MRRHRGLTLTELLVALAIVAVLVTAAVPGLAGLLDRQRLRAAADDLHGALYLARAEAIRRAMPVSVAFTGTGTSQWCYAVSAAPACDCGVPDDCDLPGVAPHHARATDFARVALLTNFAPLDAVTFHPARGTATAGTARLVNGAGEARLVVSALGRVRACSDALADYPPC